MRRFWLVMLSLGLVLAVSSPAFAVDVKVSGSFYIAGMYMDKTNFLKNDYAGAKDPLLALPVGFTGAISAGHSTAFYYQRLRVQTDFIFSPTLKLVTSFDALERIWGGARGDTPKEPGAVNSTYDTQVYNSQSEGTRTENQNIAFDWAYLDWISPIGWFHIGYQPDNIW